MSRVALLLLTAFLLFAYTEPTRAQPLRAGEAFYLKFGQGASDLSGNAGTGTGLGDLVDSKKFSGDDPQYAFSLEMGYRFSGFSSLGVGYQLGSYYHPAREGRRAGSEYVHTVQLLARRKFGSRGWRVVPYVDVGLNASAGVERISVGPSLGVGLSVAVDRRMSIFLESRLNVMFPNQTTNTNGSFGPRWIYSTILSEAAPFDVVSSLPALGVEIDLR